MKNVRSSQASISVNSCVRISLLQFLQFFIVRVVNHNTIARTVPYTNEDKRGIVMSLLHKPQFIKYKKCKNKQAS